jgi:putative ABC transport system substrate-binding protein
MLIVLAPDRIGPRFAIILAMSINPTGLCYIKRLSDKDLILVTPGGRKGRERVPSDAHMRLDVWPTREDKLFGKIFSPTWHRLRGVRLMEARTMGGRHQDPKIVSLYDRFTHGGMDRREFLDRLAELAGSTAAAVALLPLLQNDHAQGAIVAPDDMTSQAYNEDVQLRSKKGRLVGPQTVIIGFLGGATQEAWTEFYNAFTEELKLLGWNEGSDFRIDPKWASGKKEKYTAHAKQLAKQSDIIVTAGTLPLQALINETSQSIVVASAGYTNTGMIPGRVTGFLNGQATFAAERFKKFSEAVGNDRLKKMAVMANVDAPNATAEQKAVMEEAKAVDPIKLDINESDEIGARITALSDEVKSLYVCTDPLITANRLRINQAAQAKQLPTMYPFREHVTTGGLMSYGPDFKKMFRDSAALVSRFLMNKQLPSIAEPDENQFELVFNRTTAGLLKLPVPSGFNGVIIN